MRTTNSMMSRQLMNNLSLNYKKLVKYQAQVSTGRKFQRPSERPFDAVMMIDIKAKLGRLLQYKKNVADSLAVTEDTEQSLRRMNESLVGIKEIIIRGINGTYTVNERTSMAEVLEAQKESIISELNKEFAGKYLFGGINTSDLPFKQGADGIEYNGIKLMDMTQAQFDELSSHMTNINISSGTQIDIAMPGVSIIGFGQDNLFNMIDELIDIYKTEPFDSQKVQDIDQKNEAIINKVQNNISKLGGRYMRLEAMDKKLSDSEFSMKNLYYNLEGVDIEKAVIDFKTAEMVYNAALSVGAKIIQPTLIDYLR